MDVADVSVSTQTTKGHKGEQCHIHLGEKGQVREQQYHVGIHKCLDSNRQRDTLVEWLSLLCWWEALLWISADYLRRSLVYHTHLSGQRSYNPELSYPH